MTRQQLYIGATVLILGGLALIAFGLGHQAWLWDAIFVLYVSWPALILYNVALLTAALVSLGAVLLYSLYAF